MALTLSLSRYLLPTILSLSLTLFQCMHAESVELSTSPAVVASQRVEASVSAESALIDKETGRIFLEGGSTTTLKATLGPKLSEFGIRHVKARILSGLLLLVVLGAFSSWLRDRMQNVTASLSTDRSLLKSILLFVLQWSILRLPVFGPKFVTVLVMLYLIESYTCSTRRYMSRAMDLDEVESYIEGLRNTRPKICWTLRAYETDLIAPIRLLKRCLQMKARNSDLESNPSSSASLLSTRKISKVATECFSYQACVDDSTAGVWRRAPSSSSKTDKPPFCKVGLRQHALFQDGATRQNYLKQQGEFMATHVQGDQYADYATKLELEGFRTQILAVRRGKIRLAMFWLCTLLGFTVSYREWFANQCDEVRVTVVKELNSSPPSRSWFKREQEQEDNLFPSLMRRLRLYSVLENTTLPSTDTDIPACENSQDNLANFSVTPGATQVDDVEVAEVDNSLQGSSGAVEYSLPTSNSTGVDSGNSTVHKPDEGEEH